MRVTFVADGVQSRLGGHTHGRRAPQYLLRSLSGGEGNNRRVVVEAAATTAVCCT